MVKRGDIYCHKTAGIEYIVLETRLDDDGMDRQWTYFLSPISKGLDFSGVKEIDERTFAESYGLQWKPKVGDIIHKLGVVSTQLEYMIYKINNKGVSFVCMDTDAVYITDLPTVRTRYYKK